VFNLPKSQSEIFQDYKYFKDYSLTVK